MSLRDAILLNEEARGLAIIVTNDYSSGQSSSLGELLGTRTDGQNMEEAFNHLGFVVHWKHNISSEELTQLIHEATSFEGYHNLKKYKCIVFVFSGHGDCGDLVYLQDGSKVSICDGIINPFLPKSCPNMGQLQKLFFFDCCRGKEEMETVMVAKGGSPKGKSDQVETRGSRPIDSIRIPAEGGILVAYSTMSNYLAWDIGRKGGAWLHRLAAKIRESRASIEDVLTQVNADLKDAGSKFVQQPEKLSRLNELVYLHPDRDQDKGKKKKPIIAAVFSSPSVTSQEATQPSAGAQAIEVICDGPHFRDLVSQYPSAHFTDHPHVPSDRGLNIPYYRSQVTVCVSHCVEPIIGDSVQYFVSISLSREEAAKDALTKLTTPNPGHVAQRFQQQMNTFFQKNNVRPQFEFQSDSTRGPTRYRCIVRYTLNSQQKKVDSGHFYRSKGEAKEQVAKLVIARENTGPVVSKGATPPDKVWKSKLKEYCDKACSHLMPVYTTKPSGSGFISAVAFIGRNIQGEVCKSKQEAEQSAAQYALKSVGLA